MTEPNLEDARHIPVSLTVTYFVLSLLAPWPIALAIVEARVAAANRSNFEGASGMVVLQTPIWAGLLMVAAWVAYVFLRRHRALLWTGTALLALPSLASIAFVIDLLR